jgi:molybdopterin converting factor small subunit
VSVTVAFPALFAERIGGVEAVELEGETVGAALRALTDRHDALTPLVWRPEHELNPVMAVFLNGRQLRPEELTTPTRSGDQIQILSALEGG